MGRAIHRLNDRFCRTAKPGRYHDGGGLLLVVTSPTARSWLFRWKVAGKRREMGLGSLNSVGLAQARDEAAQARADRAQGRDPKIARAARKAGVLTFGEATGRLIESIEAGWKNAKHRRQWKRSLEMFAAPLWSMPVNAIGREDVVRSLSPIWLRQPVTAARTRGRIERVLDWCKVQGFRNGDNPAVLRGRLEHLLPKQPSKRKRIKHHPALGYAELPAFMAQLRGMDSIGARALQFLILSAGRTSEILGAAWSEIDFDAALWTVPANRMKAGKAHRVPLASAALSLLRSLAEEAYSPYVFPGLKRGQPLSGNALIGVLQRMGRTGITVHGFRSTFRQWCAEQTNFPREIAEAALAHINPDEVEAAYQRSDLLERRRRLAEAWASFCSKPPVSGIVLPMRR